MFGLFDHLGNRPVAPEERMPGQYVKQKYDQHVIGSSIEGFRKNSLKFLASGFGKGVMLAALLTIGVLTVGTGVAAATGSLEVMSSMGTMVNGTVLDGVTIGLGKALSFLLQPAGLLTMGAAGVVGAVTESRRHPENVSVEQAKALAEKYEQERQLGIQRQREQQLNPLQATTPEKESTDKNASFAARELQRRNDAQLAQEQAR